MSINETRPNYKIIPPKVVTPEVKYIVKHSSAQKKIFGLVGLDQDNEFGYLPAYFIGT